MRGRSQLSVLWLVVTLAAGCPAATVPLTPAEVTEAHVTASRFGDQRRASQWLAPSAVRRGLPWPEPGSVPKGAVREATRSAVWVLPSGQRVVVRRDAAGPGAGGWRIQSGVLDLDRASTPAQALAVLARVIKARDYAGLLQLLLDAERRFWTVERLAAAIEGQGGDTRRLAAWTALAESLAEPPANGWPLVWLTPGQKVRVDVAQGDATTTLVLVKEAAGWKVLDLKPWSLYTARR